MVQSKMIACKTWIKFLKKEITIISHAEKLNLSINMIKRRKNLAKNRQILDLQESINKLWRNRTVWEISGKHTANCNSYLQIRKGLTVSVLTHKADQNKSHVNTNPWIKKSERIKKITKLLDRHRHWGKIRKQNNKRSVVQRMVESANSSSVAKRANV